MNDYNKDDRVKKSRKEEISDIERELKEIRQLLESTYENEQGKNEDNDRQNLPDCSELPATDEVPAGTENEKSSVKLEIYDGLQTIVSAIVICVMVFLFVGRIITVDGSSMYPTLHDSDMLLLSGLFYEPKQGDVVVFTKETYSDQPLVKRVIAVEGQTVDIDFERGIVYVDGVELDEPYVASPTNLSYDMVFPITVDEGCVFVMGDNRNKSQDSRFAAIGQVDKRCILGKVYCIILPFSRIGAVS